MLEDLDSAISGESRGTLDWVISDLSMGSLVVELKSISRLEDRNVGPRVAVEFVRGLYQIEHEGTTPAYLSESGMQSARHLLKTFGKNGASGLVVAYQTERVELSARATANIDPLLKATARSIGSVEGRLETISVHRKPKFIIYHDRTRKAVTCRFDLDKWLEKVKEFLGQRVNVTGVIHSNSRGEPLRVELEHIRPLRENSSLPSTAELGGSDPDFTGPLTTEEFIRSIRVG